MTQAIPPTHLDRLPILPFMDPRLLRGPGVLPLDPADWLMRDATFAAQMAARDALIAERPGEVMALLPGAEAAAVELLEVVLAAVARDPGYAVGTDAVIRPDGVTVALSGDPVATAGRLVQEDLLILDRPDDAAEHRLAGGVLCFPARWSLAQKMARGLLGVHRPVPFYADALGARVQRLFDAIRPERPLWRANWVLHNDPALFHPAREEEKGRRDIRAPRLWLRVERQSLLRLPRTGAVVFGIRTFCAPLDRLTGAELGAMRAALDDLPPEEYRMKGGDVLRERLVAMAAAAD
jgi:dimethylamine monooxygenase subunit A